MASPLDPSQAALPKRSELPSLPNAPAGAAWLWGKDDELGRLNMLTTDRKLAAAKLIRTGETINLDLRSDLPSPPVFGREPFQHEIKKLNGGQGNDDLFHMNTQSGSQWDGYRHVATKHNDKWIFYNGITQEDIESPQRSGGMQSWAEHGVAGRAVLLDVWSHLGKSYDPFTTRPITLEELKSCADAQGVQFQYGDILIIRSGWLDAYTGMSSAARQALGDVKDYAHEFVGVEQTSEMLDFLHDNYFSAVAGDTPGFEAWPPKPPHVLHAHLLPLWGLPIGEMWDLEQLAETCKKYKQYAFFFSSSPSNVPGGVGSHPNAMAIF
ncbi:hypothetical protein CKM354_001097700 [Cercospora kikuchii]|uniref:Cyclase n=1 Tax=Cercospora kikuchii TaxID=84275 RepID=A0A9P3CW85_9PEZI|nr:uncharacterized protein CKM354_001097700 [Cercospora kikuchii]GIZ47900.1 hypothetical protein CKM354_001097700 [Cercospora kikuchii]